MHCLNQNLKIGKIKTMKTIQIDKIGAVTKNLNLAHEESVSDIIPAELGTVLAAEILEDKSVYSELELPSGRFSRLKKGDTVAVALGERAALKGFTGRIPAKVKTGDVIHLLNMGGVAGECTSANTQEVGNPLRIRVLGGITRRGKVLNIADAKTFEASETLNHDIPLIIVTGTSMDSGKTTVAVEVVKTLSRMGLKLGGAKLTGVGALRDLFKMEDYGVSHTASFLDCGIPSTANTDSETIRNVAKGALNHLGQHKPDIIMIEFGDGFMGRYGVRAILEDAAIQNNVLLHIGCASDPAGAIKLYELCEGIGLPLDVLSGPVTDNEVGKSLIQEHTGALVYNAFNPAHKEWLDLIIARWAVSNAA